MSNPWNVIDRPAINFGSGGEQLARATIQQISANLEAQCQLQETIWAQRDQDWATSMGLAYAPTRITRVQPGSFYTGMQPSLVESRFDLWPAITVRSGNRTPSDDREQFDQYDTIDVEIIIEVLTFAGPFQNDPVTDRNTSDAVDRQYQRLSDAVIGCIATDKTLAGHVLPIKRPPRMTPSAPFVLKADNGSGAFLVYQGMELRYIVTQLLY
jgi:hypothetical protein